MKETKERIAEFKKEKKQLLLQSVLDMLADLNAAQREKILDNGTPEELADFCKEKYDAEFDLRVEALGIAGADEIAEKEALGIFKSFDLLVLETLDDEDDGYEKIFQIKADETVFIKNKDMFRSSGFSFCPIGWGGLVGKLFDDIRDLCNKHQSAFPRILQVKSKFGLLCFYLDYTYPLFDTSSEVGIEVIRLIEAAEEKSASICEATGLPGSRYITQSHWQITLNEEKAKELGYKLLWEK